MKPLILSGGIILLLMTGCGRVQSPLPRLEAEHPLRTNKYKVVQCLVDGRDSTEVTGAPLRFRRGQQVEFTGRLHSGEWPTEVLVKVSDVTNKTATGILSVPTRNQPTKVKTFTDFDFATTVSLIIHGDRPDVQLGVVAAESVEVRILKGERDEVQFLAKMKVPAKPGTYVIDLTAFDRRDRPRRNVIPTKPGGVPIWRRELVVD